MSTITSAKCPNCGLGCDGWICNDCDDCCDCCLCWVDYDYDYEDVA